MAQIETRWITLVQEKALSLAAETWMRRLPFNRNWQRIRFGFMASLSGGFIEQQNAATTLNDIKIMAGVVTEDAWQNGLLNASSGIGVNFTGSPLVETAASLTAASAFPTQLWITSAPQAFTFHTEPGGAVLGVGQTRLPVAFSGGVAIYPDGNTDGMKRRGIYVVDIVRNQGGGGTITIDAYFPPTNATGFTASAADLMDAIATLGTTVAINTVTLTRSSLTTVSLPETGIGLNTLFIHCSSPNYPLMVYAVAALVYNDTPYGEPSGSEFWTNELAMTGTETPVGSSNLVGGHGWSDAYWTLTGTGNSIESFGLSGTSAGFPWDVFQLYDTSSTVVGSGSLPSTALNYGTGWDGPATLYGTSALGPQSGWSGTTMGWPWEVLQLYDTSNTSVYYGSLSDAAVNYGTGWDGPASFFGTSSAGPQNGWSGTSMGWPSDSFEQYNTGAVTSGVTINAGTGWAEPAVIN